MSGAAATAPILRKARRRKPPVPGRLFFTAVVAFCLLSGMVGGLLRAGVTMPSMIAGDWLTQAVQHHAFLMICAFLGTVIGIERAVAVKQRWAFSAPFASALAGGLGLAGMTAWSAGLAVLAAVLFVAVNILVVLRQQAAHTVMLLVAAGAWLVGNLSFSLARSPQATVMWWFTFLVLTIAAERLEMTRLMRRRPGASTALYLVVLGLFGACTLAFLQAADGGAVFGAALLALSAWLIQFDIARRTVRADGLSRYMAVCLLLSYFWLGVAGLAWIASSLGWPWTDAAIHALALGFVFSMMLGHAPVILPAVARVKLLFSGFFYVPLAVLHLSLAVRLFASPVASGSLALGAMGNVLAVLLFAGTVGAAAVAWRRKYASAERNHRHALDSDS